MNEETSLAYEYHRFEETQTPVIQTVKTAAAAKQNKKKHHSGVLKAASCMLMLVLVLSALIYKRVVQTELSAEYNQTLTKLNTIKGENARLQVKLEEWLSADSVEKIARDQLNMQEIDNSKIEYLNFNSEAKAEVLVEKSWLDSVKDWFDNLFE